VYGVTRLSAGRGFALKVMSGSVSAEAGARFAREAEIAARIDDPHLVKVVDVSGAASGRLYLVMELIDGGSLEEQRGRFGDVPWALQVLGGMARGLRALHAAGVVHRDLKPANVLLTTGRDQLVKISDFGISRLDDEEPPPEREEPLGLDSTHVPARLTRTGALMGTPAYMSPELASGHRAGPEADLFAFGLVAYELLTGGAAFREPPVFSAMAGRRLAPVAPLPAQVPAPIAALVLQCLAEASSARPTAQDFIDAEKHQAVSSRTDAPKA
jgi:eukaryotic-like serine/threonine-protein kinase